ncbi:MAG: ASKHA domain-containing protein [Anaerolineae bacterium]
MSAEAPRAHRVVFQPSGRQGQVPEGMNLLAAARSLGVEIESICNGRQTCGKCQVVVEEGHFPKYGITSAADHLSAVDGREAHYFEKHPRLPGRRLACACEVHGDLLLFVPEESQARKQVVRKAATERAIEVDPAIRLYYVEVAEPTLEHQLGDWDRIAAELEANFGLRGVRLDPLLLGELQEAVRRGDWKVTVTVWQGREAVRVQPGYAEGAYGLAADIGTTTVAMHLCDLRTGQVLATVSGMNPQVAYGEDLMSRVSYCDDNGPAGLTTLHNAIIAALNELAAEAASEAGITTDAITDIVLVGNSVMHHILLNIPPHQLGQSPFAPAISDAVDIKARDLGLTLARGAQAHILPLEAGHVGADNVAVILAEEPDKAPEDEVWLIVDVGTNGEILLGNRRELYSASSPTGPAFEGAQIRHGMRAAPGAIERVRVDPDTLEVRFKVIGREEWSDQWPNQRMAKSANQRGVRHSQSAILAAGICGSGIIEAVAELFMAGVLTPDGRFAPEIKSPRLSWREGKAEFVLAWPHESSTGCAIVITSDDVRNIQLGKAALYSGARLLMERMGVTRVDRVLLAGAFGSYIDPLHAMVIGMIPDCDLAQVVTVGNSAGDGARIALLNRAARAEARRLARWTHYVGIALEPRFQEAFVEAIPLPHHRDAFPHLAGILEATAQRRRARGVSDAVFSHNRRRIASAAGGVK